MTGAVAVGMFRRADLAGNNSGSLPVRAHHWDSHEVLAEGRTQEAL